MSIRLGHISAICALAAATALLGGCASTPSVPAAQMQASARVVPSIALPQIQRVLRGTASMLVGPTRFLPARKITMWIYTAQLYGDDLEVYEQNGGPSLTFFESLTQGLSAPQGTVATINGWLYVANGGRSNVLIYRSKKQGPSGPLGSLDDYGQVPGNVDVIPNRRLVAVSNVSTTSGGAGSVSVYLNRNVEPSRTLTYGTDLLQGIGIAVDRQGNCYWSFNDPSTGNGSIVEFAGCSGSGTLIVPTIAFAGGLAFDQHNDMYYVDQTKGIYKCQGTSNCTLFSTGPPYGDPVNINFDLKQKHLWVADATGYIDAVKPRNGQIEYSMPVVGGPSEVPYGIAPAPGG
jgi:DNA-binding beta-propeller fold protein YncE